MLTVTADADGPTRKSRFHTGHVFRLGALGPEKAELLELRLIIVEDLHIPDIVELQTWALLAATLRGCSSAGMQLEPHLRSFSSGVARRPPFKDWGLCNLRCSGSEAFAMPQESQINNNHYIFYYYHLLILLFLFSAQVSAFAVRLVGDVVYREATPAAGLLSCLEGA